MVRIPERRDNHMFKQFKHKRLEQKSEKLKTHPNYQSHLKLAQTLSTFLDIFEFPKENKTIYNIGIFLYGYAYCEQLKNSNSVDIMAGNPIVINNYNKYRNAILKSGLFKMNLTELDTTKDRLLTQENVTMLRVRQTKQFKLEDNVAKVKVSSLVDMFPTIKDTPLIDDYLQSTQTITPTDYKTFLTLDEYFPISNLLTKSEKNFYLFELFNLSYSEIIETPFLLRPFLNSLNNPYFESLYRVTVSQYNLNDRSYSTFIQNFMELQKGYSVTIPQIIQIIPNLYQTGVILKMINLCELAHTPEFTIMSESDKVDVITNANNKLYSEFKTDANANKNVLNAMIDSVL